MQKKRFTPSEAKQKIHRYCAYQERSHLEVKRKLFEFGLYASEVDDLMVDLISEGYLNEERFAKTFAGGKFRQKQWGKIKIIHALEAKGVTRNCITIGLKEIDEHDYQETLHDLIKNKLTLLDEENVFSKRDKAARFAIQRGFEPELVWKTVKEILPG